MLFLFFMLAVVVFYFAGPKVSSDTSYSIPDLPDDLDQFLETSESGCDDLTPGTEKVIHWADPERKNKTPIAFVYLHGFSATRQESMPVPDLVAKHFNCNIYYARLTGNGRSADAVALGTVNRWVNDASEAMAIARRIGHKTILIGCSTGASLGWWTAMQKDFSDQTAALIFFSPNFGTADPRGTLLTIRWGKILAEAIIGKNRKSEPVSEAHEKYWAMVYPTKALLPMMAMVKLAKKCKPTQWKKPIFICYSPYDDTVDANKIRSFCEKLTCQKRVLEIDDPSAASQHVIVGDILAPQNNKRVTDAIIDFIETDVQDPLPKAG